MSAPAPSRARSVGFFLLTAMLVLGVIEGSARVFMAGLEPTGFDDASWRNAWLRDHAGDDRIYYGFDRFDPTKGWISKSDLRDHVAFGDKTLSTNSLGLRGTRELDEFAAYPGLRIVSLGDSFTFGDEVGDDETWSARLEARLPGARVMNFGVHGYGHDQMLILLRELGATARPDVVVLGFVYADIHRNLLGFRDFAKPHFAVEGDALILKGLPLPTPEEVRRRAWLRPAVIDVASVARGLFEASSGRLDARARELTRHLLDALLAEIRGLGALPVFVYLPIEDEIENVQQEPTSQERYLLAHCAARSVDCFSLRPIFAATHASGKPIKTIGHWGARGQRVAGDAVAVFISSLVESRPALSKRIGRGLENDAMTSSVTQ